ncbi:MAG: HNH endonuclease [Fermentimonas sp.]|jgi:putative restriction endonuclease
MNKWTREETIVAFNLYCKIPFKSCSKTHPMIIKYANILGRTPSALNMKIGNIGRLDPDLKEHGIVGLTHGAKMEGKVWEEFYGNPELIAFESEKIIAKLSNLDIEVASEINLDNLPQGKERLVEVKQRINQSFFRSSVMSAYNYRCCISGVNAIELLEACHIVDWSHDDRNRMNPKNGICMNSFFHKAYDKHLLGITPDMQIIVSEELQSSCTEESFLSYLKDINGRSILLPDKFLPQKDLLEIHYENFRKRQFS